MTEHDDMNLKGIIDCFDYYERDFGLKGEQIRLLLHIVTKYEDALKEIDTHIRSTPHPIPYIIKTLKGTLPEYE